MKKLIGIIILIILALIIIIALINHIAKDENGLVYSIAIYDYSKNKENVIVESYEELNEYFNEEYMKHAPDIEEIIKTYNNEFFENNNLAIICEKTGNISTMFKYIKCNVKETNAKITYQIISPKGGTPDVFAPRDIFVVVKIPKEVTSISENPIYKYK